MKKIGKGLQFFYFFVLVAFLALLGTNLYLFMSWKLSDASYLSSIHEAEIMSDKLAHDNIPEEISRLVYSDQVRGAVKIFDEFELDVKKLTKIRKVDQQEEFLLSLAKTKKGLQKLLTFPEASSLFQVFDSKIQSLNKFTNANNWKTLLRVGERIKSKINNNTDFSVKKLNGLHSFVEKSIDAMRKVTIGSKLADDDKNLIIKYLENVQVELVLWQNYLKELDEFSEDYKLFNKSFHGWIKSINPGIALEKIEIQKRNKNYVLLQFLLMGLMVAAIFLGILFYQYYTKRILKKIENNFLEIMKKSLVATKFQDLDKNFNDNFQFEIKKGHTYIQKRMTFSSIFQKGLPFPSLLLNQNLKVIWANPSFCETFKISDTEMDKETLGWDYISRFTNLGESDPVLESLRNGISGIYQIQIRPDHNSNSTPYEMYVSAITNGGQNYVMIFLYSLTFVNESIQNQVKSVIRPITKTLKDFIKNEFNDDYLQNAKEEFERAEILEVLELFNELYENLNLRQEGLLCDISKLESDVNDHHKMVNDFTNHNNAFKEVQVELLNTMKNLKKNIVSYVEGNNGHLSLSDQTLEDLRELTEKCRELYNASREESLKIDEMKKIVTSLDKVKMGIKPLNETLLILNNRITQNFDKILLYDGVENIDIRKLAAAVQKTKIEFDHLNKKLGDFSNVLKYIDLKLSKASMVFSDNESIEKIIVSFEEQINDYVKRAEERFYHKNKVSETIQVHEDKIIKTVESFFTILKKNLRYYSTVDQMIKSYLSKENSLIENSSSENEEKSIDHYDVLSERDGSSSHSEITQ